MFFTFKKGQVRQRFIQAKAKMGQAITEMAIFGSLIIVVFGTMLYYSQSMKEQQIVEMLAFRKALFQAYEDNSYVSYQVIRDKRFVSPNNAFGNKDRATVSGSAAIYWSNKNEDGGKEGSYLIINEDKIQLQGSIRTGTSEPLFNDDPKQNGGGTWVKFGKPIQVWDTETYSTTTHSNEYTKEEKNNITEQ